METKVRAHVIFRGKVQGVNFRVHAQEKAVGLGLTGWVQNLPNREVEAVFEGEGKLVEEAVAWCRDRQPYAQVSEAEVTFQPYAGEYTTFEVRR